MCCYPVKCSYLLKASAVLCPVFWFLYMYVCISPFLVQMKELKLKMLRMYTKV